MEYGGGDERTWKQRVHDYWVNDGVKAIFIGLFVVGNLVCFFERFFFYELAEPENAQTVCAAGAVNPPQECKPYLAHETLGMGVSVARGAAAALKFNCSFILIGVLRNFLSWLRGTWVNNYLPIDKNLVFHRRIGWVIAFWVLLHVFAHFFNFNNVSRVVDNSELRWFTKDYPESERDPNKDPPTVNQSAFGTIPGGTGQLAVLCMIFMYTTAFERMRRPYFELFWYTHHLFIVFYGALIFHGFAEILEKPTFWIWLIGPGSLYLLERTIRIIRGSRETTLELAIMHPSKVIELRMSRAGFQYKPGQYLFLNCPFIARQEWHPFTISSSPDGEDYVSVHIRIVGDWTGKLYRLLNAEEKLGVVQRDVSQAPNGLDILRIDGPFGAASEEAFEREIAVLVGAGIGVTPFASILKTINFRLQQGTPMSLKRVYFYWINRDRKAFEWFSDLLQEMEAGPAAAFLTINVYLTERVSKEDDIRAIMMEEDAGPDAVTGLSSGTHYGRPPWEKIFLDLEEAHSGETVGVFFCGPAVLSKLLYKTCRAHTRADGTKFLYRKENF